MLQPVSSLPRPAAAARPAASARQPQAPASISQVCRRYSISADTLRYYERAGVLPPAARTPGGRRVYDEAACRNIEFVLSMRALGVRIDTLVQYRRMLASGQAVAQARRAILLRTRAQMLDAICDAQEKVRRIDQMAS